MAARDEGGAAPPDQVTDEAGLAGPSAVPAAGRHAGGREPRVVCRLAGDVVVRARRYPVLLVKASAFDVKLIGPFLRVLGQLPVRRGETDAALVLQEAERALAAGECVVIYPERTARPGRVADDGPDRRGPAGAGHWCRGDPGRLVGALQMLPYGSTQPHLVPRKTVRMLAGPPVDLSAFEGKAAHQGCGAGRDKHHHGQTHRTARRATR